MTDASIRLQPLLRAQLEADACAILDDLVALKYPRESAPVSGMPPFVRAASALRRFGNRFVIVQDDVDALAVLDAEGRIEPALLPLHASGVRSFGEAAGTKHWKMDLEAAVTFAAGRFVAFGSGSSERRETLIIWRDAAAQPTRWHAPDFYAELRSALGCDTADLNIEGAVVDGMRLLLFQRGNGIQPLRALARNAVLELAVADVEDWVDGRAAVPRVRVVTPVDLGAIDGVSFGFTDAVSAGDGRIVVLLCAEDSVGTTVDGPVLGCRVGMLDANGLRVCDVVDPAGKRTRLKLEGIEPFSTNDREYAVVVDVDRPGAAAQLGRLRLPRL